MPPIDGAQGSDGASQLEAQRLWAADASDEAGPAEDRLAQLAGAVGPLRRVLAAIAERLLATEAHARLCYARVGDYARERAGLSVRQLQELARVHRAFAERPRRPARRAEAPRREKHPLEGLAIRST